MTSDLEQKQFSILFEDEHLLVISKPFGVVVNRARTVKGKTVQDWMDERLNVEEADEKFKESDFYKRSGLVHRLDKETSGCLILAKNEEAFQKLQASFKERNVKKEYVALVHGKLVPEKGEINAPVGRLPWNRERFGVVPGGKEARTKYHVSGVMYQEFKGKKEFYSFVNLFPETGRTHQLRVHMKYLGFPIVADYLYAGRKRHKKDRKWCPRVFLHAGKIEFPHPDTGKVVVVEAPLPEELIRVTRSLLQED